MEKIILLLATGFGTGAIPRLFGRDRGGGLFGAALGIPLLYLFSSPRTFIAFLASFVLFSVWISGRAEKIYGGKDDHRIVIDETAGYLASMAFLPLTFKALFFTFILFRILDVYKLPFYRKFEKLPGGWGIVMDDLAAGILTNLILQPFRSFLS